MPRNRRELGKSPPYAVELMKGGSLRYHPERKQAFRCCCRLIRSGGCWLGFQQPRPQGLRTGGIVQSTKTSKAREGMMKIHPL